MKARPYQVKALEGIHQQWADSASTLAVLATGLGKTVIAGHAIASRLPAGRALFLAHREELIWQACDKIQKIAGIAPAVEMANYRADMEMFSKSPVIVSTVQTQYSGAGGDGRMSRFNPSEFATLVVDEAHHYVAPSYKRVIDYYRQNPNLKVLGITATPDRADEAAMGRIFETVACNYGILEGIQDGWLVNVEQRMVHVDGLDLSNVRTTGGDLNSVELAEVMELESNLHQIASPLVELAGNRRTLVFAASVAHAERLAEIFNRHRRDSARWVCGETPKDTRREMFADYAAGRFQFLCNVGVATEGFDDPGVEVVAMARPTKSRALYAQCVGRGTRPLPGIVDLYDDGGDRRIAIIESDKPCCEVIDFVGNSGKHKLVTTADILGGEFEDEVVQRAQAKVDAAGASLDMLEALKESLAEMRAEQERAKAAEAARRAKLRVGATYSTQTVDPFDVFEIQPHREMGWETGKPLTEKMKGLLEKQGIDPEGMSYSKAQQLISEMFRRWDANECSYRQSKLLKRYGLSTHMTRQDASAAIDAIKANNWKLPDSLKGKVEPVEVF